MYQYVFETQMVPLVHDIQVAVTYIHLSNVHTSINHTQSCSENSKLKMHCCHYLMLMWQLWVLPRVTAYDSLIYSYTIVWYILQHIATVYLLRTKILWYKQWNAMINALCIMITGYLINCLMFSISQFINTYCNLIYHCAKIIFKVYSSICNLIYHSAKKCFQCLLKVDHRCFLWTILKLWFATPKLKQ